MRIGGGRVLLGASGVAVPWGLVTKVCHWARLVCCAVGIGGRHVVWVVWGDVVDTSCGQKSLTLVVEESD